MKVVGRFGICYATYHELSSKIYMTFWESFWLKLGSLSTTLIFLGSSQSCRAKHWLKKNRECLYWCFLTSRSLSSFVNRMGVTATTVQIWRPYSIVCRLWIETGLYILLTQDRPRISTCVLMRPKRQAGSTASDSIISGSVLFVEMITKDLRLGMGRLFVLSISLMSRLCGWKPRYSQGRQKGSRAWRCVSDVLHRHDSVKSNLPVMYIHICYSRLIEWRQSNYQDLWGHKLLLFFSILIDFTNIKSKIGLHCMQCRKQFHFFLKIFFRFPHPRPLRQEDELLHCARAIGYGAVKYFDLKNNPVTNYVFNYDRMLDTKYVSFLLNSWRVVANSHIHYLLSLSQQRRHCCISPLRVRKSCIYIAQGKLSLVWACVKALHFFEYRVYMMIKRRNLINSRANYPYNDENFLYLIRLNQNTSSNLSYQTICILFDLKVYLLFWKKYLRRWRIKYFAELNFNFVDNLFSYLHCLRHIIFLSVLRKNLT